MPQNEPSADYDLKLHKLPSRSYIENSNTDISNFTSKNLTEDLLRDYIYSKLLKDFNIDVRTIKSADQDVLKDYLKKLDDIILHRKIPEFYSFIHLRNGEVVIRDPNNPQDQFRLQPISHAYKVASSSILFELKIRLIEMIGLLEGTKKFDSIRELIQNLPDKNVKLKLENELNELQLQAQHLREQVQETEKQQEIEKAKEEWQLTLRQRKAEVRELEWKLWRSLIERESVSTIIGALLLLIIVVALIAAMFYHATSPEILNNAFLVILGYFFGQTVGKIDGKGKSDGDKG
ncbi:hypothetical protein KSD_33620 [Ktedonobacter sp. SOSP1-85]|uniref:hypothetical protein n=1 Tax=Ktedonobacter sp. SOSP1-85 TaxID=2778367 RepID=UPI001915FBEF|nr:hypothetical protein [Ktedonobacter sp. SOSP1-85]GHO75591.1 hypothetical protein KSD_33620 [Ktedonobacter sp. SOSP1-85]